MRQLRSEKRRSYMSQQTFRQQFIERLTALVIDQNVSNRKLSEAIGKSSGYIQGILNGSYLPSLDTFFDLCDYFGITPYEFFVPSRRPSAEHIKLYHLLNQCDKKELSFALTVIEELRKLK